MRTAIARTALPVTAAFATVLALAGPAAAATASIDVFPVPAVAGQQVSVVGHGFCAAGNCSTVALTIETTAVASGIKVGADGGFSTSFAVTVIPGDHDVTAVQHTPEGDRTATAHLIVLPNDNRSAPATTSRPRPSGAPNTTTAGGGTGTAGPSQRTDRQPESTSTAVGTIPTSRRTSSMWPWALGAVVVAIVAAVLIALRARRTSTG
ncbi:MAG TPA: hypothetical protein VFE14_07160 [Micromonosporaceae bacterium]|nr:hypothetical protein [Micromonosporaceae bacterium]